MSSRETAESLCSQILECWFLDVKYAIDLANSNNLEIDYEDLKSNYWTVNINTIIYDLIYRIAETFISENEIVIKQILNIWDLNEYRNNSEMYEIYTNYIDSHLWFKDERIQTLFDQSIFEV